MKSLKNKFKNYEFTLGSWITLGLPAIGEIMAKAGFDWLAIDMEHSSITFSEAEDLIRVIDLAGGTPLVRVGENSPYLIKRVMDAGAQGVIVPMINNRDDAEKAVQAVRYPSQGSRGVGLARAQNYGLGFEEYKQWLLKESLVIAQIEHIEAMDNLEDILAVDGIDATIIGPYDLSASMGYPGEFQRKEVEEIVERYQKICKSCNKVPGYHVVPCNINLVKNKMKAGFLFVGFCLDALFLAQNIKDQLKGLERNKVL